MPSFTCCICQNPIEDPIDALPSLETQEPAHFQCLFEQINEKLELASGESLAYLGSGKFAVVSGPQRIVVRKIELDMSNSPWPEWRKGLSSPILEAALSIETDV